MEKEKTVLEVCTDSIDLQLQPKREARIVLTAVQQSDHRRNDTRYEDVSYHSK